MSLQERFARVFDSEVNRHALFYNFPGGLRFELSEGGSPLDQILRALRKASSICSEVFEHTDTILVHLRAYLPDSQFELRRTLRELTRAGIPIPRDREIWLDESVGDPSEDGDVEKYFWINAAFEVPKSKVPNVLWCAVVKDFGSFGPNPGCWIYLAHPSEEIVVHPYDDRGMDVVGKNKVVLGQLFRSHHKWLLDYDVETMNRTFL